MQQKSSNSDLYFCTILSEADLNQRLGRSVVLPERVAVIFTEDGDIVLETGGSTHHITPMHFITLPPHQTVRLVSFTPGVRVFVIGFLPALQDIVSKQFSISFFYHVHAHPVSRVNERQKQALRSFYDVYEYNCNEAPGQFSTEISNSMFCIFMQTCYQAQKALIDSEIQVDTTITTRTLGSRFFKLIHENYKLHHDVAYYADVLCVSSKYLAQVVKSFSNRTPKEIIDRRLAAESLFLLTKTEMNIQEVSLELGFPDQSYFGRFFKRIFGMSPLAYRMNPDFSLIEHLTDKFQEE